MPAALRWEVWLVSVPAGRGRGKHVHRHVWACTGTGVPFGGIEGLALGAWGWSVCVQEAQLEPPRGTAAATQGHSSGYPGAQQRLPKRTAEATSLPLHSNE